MGIFATYFAFNLLAQMKWPRKRGLRGKEYYDSFIVDKTLDMMVDWAAALGAGHPELTLRILAYEYKTTNWSDDDSIPDIKSVIDEVVADYKAKGLDPTTTEPHELLPNFSFSNNFPKGIPGDAFGEASTKKVLEPFFMIALYYGLSHPKEFESAYKHTLVEFENNKEVFNKMELEMEQLPSLDQNYVNAKEIIDNYKADMGVEFPNPTPQLRKIVETIRP